MRRLRSISTAPYHGTGKRWLPGEERDVDDSRAEFLLRHMGDVFEEVGAVPPVSSEGRSAGAASSASPPKITKPARGRKK